MLTMFQSTHSSTRSRNAKVRARRATLESLETRQLLNGSVVLNFGQTLASVAPAKGVDSHGASVLGTYLYQAHVGGVLQNVGNNVLHATTPSHPDVITQTFTPTADPASAVTDTLSVEVDKANWQITANSISGVYNGHATALDGTIAFQSSPGTWTTFTESSSAPSSANAYMPTGSLTYSVTGLVGNQTSLTHAISNAAITPSVNTAATEWDGVSLSNDITFSYVAGTANIAPKAVNGVITANSQVYNGSNVAQSYTLSLDTQQASLSFNDGAGNVATAELDVSLQTTGQYAGQYLVTGGDLVVTGGSDPGVYSLVTGGPGVFITNVTGGYFTTDNLISGSSSVDAYGLLWQNGAISVNIDQPTSGQSEMWIVNNGHIDVDSVQSNLDLNIQVGPVVQVTDPNVQLTGTNATFNSPNVADANTVTLNGAVLMGSNAGDYVLENAGSITTPDTITQATASIVVTPYSSTYNGAAQVASATATGNGENLIADLDLTGTTHTKAGDYTTDSWVFHDPNGNYADASGTNLHDHIAPLNLVGSFTAHDKTYDGNSAAIVTNVHLVGVVGNDQVTLEYTGAAFGGPNVNGNTAYVTLTNPTIDGADASNYFLVSVPQQTAYITKADATITVTGYTNIPYDGQLHTATGTAIGVQGELLAGLDLSDTSHSQVSRPGEYNDSWVFIDTTGNYNNAAGPVVDTITHGTPVVASWGTASGITYGQNLHDSTLSGGTASVGGTFVWTTSDADLTSFPNVGNGLLTESVTFVPGDSGYASVTSMIQVHISQATATIQVNGYTGSYDGQAHGPSFFSADGVPNGAAIPSTDVHLGQSFTNYPGGTSSWTFHDPDGNYADQSNNSVSIAISPAAITIPVGTYSATWGVIVNGLPTSYSTGVNGESLDVNSWSPAVQNGVVDTVSAGPHSLTPTLANNADYSVTLTPGTLNVAKADLIVAATNQYNSATGQFNVYYQGFANGDTADLLSVTATLGTDGKTITPVVNSVLVNYNPVIQTATLAPASPPNLGTGGSGGFSGGSSGVSAWNVADNSGPVDIDGQLVLDTTIGSKTFGQFVVKKHSN